MLGNDLLRRSVELNRNANKNELINIRKGE
nr:MAG TPA: hypothetical protein [Caudoviricetes sp.]